MSSADVGPSRVVISPVHEIHPRRPLRDTPATQPQPSEHLYPITGQNNPYLQHSIMTCHDSSPLIFANILACFLPKSPKSGTQTSKLHPNFQRSPGTASLPTPSGALNPVAGLAMTDGHKLELWLDCRSGSDGLLGFP